MDLQVLPTGVRNVETEPVGSTRVEMYWDRGW